MKRFAQGKGTGIAVMLVGASVLSSALMVGCSGGSGGGGLNPIGGGGGNTTVTATQTSTPTNLGAGRSGIFQVQALSDNTVRGTLTVTALTPFPAPRAAVLPPGVYTFTGQLTGNTFTGSGRFNGTPAFDFTVSGTLATATSNGSWTITGSINGEPFTFSGTFSDRPADPIPGTMQGTHNLTYNQAAAGGPVANGTTTQFVLTADTLSFSGKTLRNPIFRNGNKVEWIFSDGNFEYAVSKAPNGTLNEINVAGPGGIPFLGQYNKTPITVPGTNGLTGSISGLQSANATAGNFNIPMQSSSIFVQTSGTRIFTAIYNDAVSATTRRVVLELRSPTALTAGQTFTLGAHGTAASMVYVEAAKGTPAANTKNWITRGGTARIDSVQGNVIRFTLQNVQMQAQTSTQATGSFSLNATGQATTS